ncbi:MAG: hypothetical protein IKH59_01775 [Bacteroidaceae bacterium]|nr:hypothetical protein [Bacteroidaceae bacterium]
MGTFYVIIDTFSDRSGEMVKSHIEGKAYTTLERALEALSDLRASVVKNDTDGYSCISPLYDNGKCFDYTDWDFVHGLEINEVEVENQ